LSRPATDRPARTYFWSIVCLAVLATPGWALANGHDLPPEILLQGFVKPEEGRAHLLVRVPLVLLTSFALPKRGPGYLDLAGMDDRLQQAAASTGRQIGLQEDGVDLVPAAIKGRISLPSDRSFASYEAALAHLEGPPLPADTDLFWNQGFFDAHLEYPIRSARGHFSISVNVAPELGERLKLQLQFLPIEGPSLTYKLPGDSGRIALDPRWYEAGWLFLKVGFVDVFAVDRLVFLLCLIAPFRQFRSLLAVVLVMSGLQALTATAIAQRALVDGPLLGALFSTALPAAIVLVAIGNLGAPSLRRRWFIGAIVGAVSGFSLGHLLADAMQFAGAHSLVSAASFNVGAVLGQAVSLALVWQAQRLLFARVLGPALGLVVLSAVLGHAGWHRMVEEGHDLMHALEHLGAWSALALVGPWMLPALVVGALAYFLPAGFGGTPVRSLLAAMLDARADERPARAA
jgi:HupE/UreJ protein